MQRNPGKSKAARVAAAVICLLCMVTFAVAAEKRTSSQAANEDLSKFSTFLVNNAYMAIRDNKLDDAKSFVARALETQPNNARLLAVMAEIVERQEDWPEADKYLSLLLVYQPADGNALARRGFVRMHLGREDSARQDFLLALDHEPDDEVRSNVLAQLAYFGSGASDVATAGEASPEPDSRAALRVDSAADEADILARLEAEKDWLALEQRYTELLAGDPENPVYLSGRGFARVEMRLFAEARSDFEKARPLAGDDEFRRNIESALEQVEAEERLIRAAADQRRRAGLRERGEWSRLERELTEALEADPGNTSLLAERGFARARLNRQSEARDDFQRVLGSSPPTETRKAVEAALIQIRAEEELALATERQRLRERLQNQERWPELERELDAALGDAPGNRALLAERGYARVRLGKYDKARDDFEQALSGEDDSDTRRSLEAALRQIEAEQEQQARQQLADAQQEIQNRVRELQDAGDDAGLAAYLDRVVEADPANAFALSSRGYLRSRQQRFDEARADFEAARAADPGSDIARGADEALANLEKERLARLPEPHGPAGKLQDATKAIADKDYALAQAILDDLDSEQLAPADRAAQTFYRAELLRVADCLDEAYPLYEQALAGVDTDFLQSECLWRMAEYNRKIENRDLAMHYAHRAARLLPDNGIRNSEVGYLFLAYLHDEEAIYYFERALCTLRPTLEQAGIYMDLGYAYKRQGDNERLHYNLHRYIDCMTVKLEGQAPHALRKDVESTYGSRREHADLVRRWGVFSGLYSYRRDNGDYAIQQINDIYWQPYFQNGRYVQAYVQTIGTVAAKYSGRVFEPLTSTYNEFNTSSHWRESFHTVVGVRVDPFSSANATIALEKVFKIGRETTNDVRVRAAHSWDTGLEYKPCTRNWLYVTTFNEAMYSLQHDNLTFVGEARLGRSFRADPVNPRLVVTPYVGPYYGYQGRGINKNERYFAEAGPGIHFRKWYREDKYNAFQSYMDVILQYRVGLTHRRENILVLNLFHSF